MELVIKILLGISAFLLFAYTFTQISLLLFIGSALLVSILVYLSQNGISTYVSYSDPKLAQLGVRVRNVIPEIGNVQLRASDQSFTINKRDVYVCMKDQDGNYYPDNMLIYVMLHELAHALCDEIEHTPKYEQIFRDLLNRAEKGGIYDSSIPVIDGYCGYS